MKAYLALISLLLVAGARTDEVEEFFDDSEDVWSNGVMAGNPVQLSVQLLSYTNMKGYITLNDMSANDTYTCVTTNAFLTGCQFQFSTILHGMPTRSYMTRYLGTPVNGVTNISGMASSKGNPGVWSMPHMSTFNMKPSSIVVVVTHDGSVYDSSQIGNPTVSQGYFIADIFTIPLANIVPYINIYNPWPTYNLMTATSPYNNTLLLRISTRCGTAGSFGPNCGYVNCVPIGNSGGSCKDVNGNAYYCKTATTVPNQYQSCTMCPTGVNPNGGCNPTTTPPSNTVTPSIIIRTNTVTNTKAKAAAIALGVILALVLIIAIGLYVRMYMKNKKHGSGESVDYNKKREDWHAKNDHSSASSTSGSETGTGSSVSTTPRSETHGFKAIPDTPDRDHLAVKQFHADDASSKASSRGTSRRSSQISHDPAAELQSAHSSLPDGGRTTPRLEARV